MSGQREESSCFLHYQKDGVEAWADTGTSGVERAGVEIVEIAPMPFKFMLTAPSATPEKVDPNAGDFPWLGPLPGSKFRNRPVWAYLSAHGGAL